MIINLRTFTVDSYQSQYPIESFLSNGKRVLVLASDTKLLSLVKEGISCISGDISVETGRQLNLDIQGIFAIIVISRDVIEVITDPYAIIKLYHFSNDEMSFLSDSLTEFKGLTSEFNKNALQYFFINGYTPSQHTFFRDIRKLEPCNHYVFDRSGDYKLDFYARFCQKRQGGTDFLETYRRTLEDSLKLLFDRYGSVDLALTGGMDSSILFRFIKKLGLDKKLNVSLMRMEGIERSVKLDNDFDIEYATRLSKDNGKTISIFPYDFSTDNLADDFLELSEILGCEFNSGVSILNYAGKGSIDTVSVSGQNADSVLSFGSMGSWRHRGFKLVGLNGVFSRYFHFFGCKLSSSPLGWVMHFLRSAYYALNHRKGRVNFTQENYFTGLGISPVNRFFYEEDQSYADIAEPRKLKDWFIENYLEPLFKKKSTLSHHALALILYNKTYMQGSANRASVLAAVAQGRQVSLPYTSLQLLELMSNLIPSREYAIYGKYPNVSLKNELEIPQYITERADPNNCDSVASVNKAFIENKKFANMVHSIVLEADLEKYEDIISSDRLNLLSRVNSMEDIFGKIDLKFLLKFIWVEIAFKRMI